jgi:hypothetical protein
VISWKITGLSYGEGVSAKKELIMAEIDFSLLSHYTFRDGSLPNCMFGTRGAKVVAKEVKG